jgi:hypothetical protein
VGSVSHATNHLRRHHLIGSGMPLVFPKLRVWAHLVNRPRVSFLRVVLTCKKLVLYRTVWLPSSDPHRPIALIRRVFRFWLSRCTIATPRMREFNTGWLASEHNRLHNIELWPDSPRKQIALIAIQSSLVSLSRHSGTEHGKFICFLCQSKSANLRVMETRGASRTPVTCLAP